MLITKQLFIFLLLEFIIGGAFLFYYTSISTESNQTIFSVPKETHTQLKNNTEELDWNRLQELRFYSGQKIINNLFFISNNTPLDLTLFSSVLQCQKRKFTKPLNQNFEYWFHANPYISEELFQEQGNTVFLIYSQKLYILKRHIQVPYHYNTFLQLLTLLLKIVKLDNVLFSVSFHDGKYSSLSNSFPTLTASKTKFSGELLIPNFQDVDRLLNRKYPFEESLSFEVNSKNEFWKKRKNVAFWRGGNSGPFFQQLQFGTFPRYRLVELSKHDPSIIDAGFSHYYPNFPSAEKREEVKQLFGTLPFVKYNETFSKYTYVISVDGNSAAWRVSTILASPSLLLKQSSIFVEHFYTMMKPWKHFVPINMNLYNLKKTVQKLNENPVQVKQIVNNQMKFAQQYLLVEGMLCYMVQLLGGLAKAQKSFHFANYANETLLYK